MPEPFTGDSAAVSSEIYDRPEGYVHYQVDRDHPDWSPIVINGETYAEHLQSREALNQGNLWRISEDGTGLISDERRRLEQVQTRLSNECKKCIDDQNMWCPTGNYSIGYCCSEADILDCPRQGLCSNDFSFV